MKLLRRVFRREEREAGQAIIMFAVMSGIMMMTMALAVEGGSLLAQYRQMQSAADMSALVGAQDLPCLRGGSPIGSTCLSASGNNKDAVADACTYAHNNGLSGVTCDSLAATAGTDHITVSAPPKSCSPYNFIDYGNRSTNSNCSGLNASPTRPGYIEVQVQRSIHVPVFNITFDMYAHAVARQGLGAPSDFAVAILNPSASSALTIEGSTNFTTVGSIMVNSDASNAINESGSAVAQACDGGWLTAGTGSSSGLKSFINASPTFADPSCGSLAKPDSPVQFYPGSPPIADPYGGGAAPPTLTGSYPNCKALDGNNPCQKAGIYYDLTNHVWSCGSTDAVCNSRTTPKSISCTDSASCNLELFPGIYQSISISNKSTLYLNPGVYTILGSLTPNHGAMCVFGSPSCDPSPGFKSDHCATDYWYKSDGTSTTTPQSWYYQCTPYGFWDPAQASAFPLSSGGTFRPSDVSVGSAPVFYDEGTESVTTYPLNGVTFFFPNVNTGITTTGNAGSNGPNGIVSLAAPNPCPGTGTFNAPTSGNHLSGTVDFPAGSSSGVYTYTATDNPNIYAHMQAASTPTAQSPTGSATVSGSTYNYSIYPSLDLSQSGECSPDNLDDWPDQFAANGTTSSLSQHLHFLVWSRAGATTDGTTTSSKSYVANAVCASSWESVAKNSFSVDEEGGQVQDWFGIIYNKCGLFKMKGAGKTDGPPWVMGQVIADTADFGGNSSTQVYYRPCYPIGACTSGPGTNLVQ